MREWADLPKLDLHLHLEGAAPAGFIRGKAAAKREDISGIFDAEGQYRKGDAALTARLKQAIASVLTTPEDSRDLLLLALEAAAEQGVIYAELLVSPLYSSGPDQGAWRDHLAALQDAAREAEAKIGIRSRALACLWRGQGPEALRRAALMAAEEAGGWLTGLVLAGEEPRVTLKDLAWPVDCAREAGLRLALASTGRETTKTIREEIHAFAPQRLSGAVSVAADLGLVEELAERRLSLTLAPLADVAAGLYPDLRNHPIAELDRRGLPVTLGSGNPALSGLPLLRHYDALQRAFDWDEGQFRNLSRQALDAAFCDSDTKEEIKKRLEC